MFNAIRRLICAHAITGGGECCEQRGIGRPLSVHTITGGGERITGGGERCEEAELKFFPVLDERGFARKQN